MHRTPQGEADADHANAASDRLVTRRRRLLLGVAGGVGLLGGGGLYVTRSLSGDFGGYDAPETQPMVTTRGRLDANKPPERSGSWDFDGADAVVLFVHGLGADAESGRDQAYTARLGLAAATDATTETDGPPVIGYSWASNVDWGRRSRPRTPMSPHSLTGCRRGRTTTGDQSTCSPTRSAPA